MTNNDKPPETLLTFPCQFVIKVMGLAKSQITTTAVAIIKQHYAEFDGHYDRRLSRDKTYIALTFTIEATSKAQLDAIYMALSECHDVIMAL